MHIGIDVATWHNNRGFGRFTRELVGALVAAPGRHEFTLLCDAAPLELEGVRQIIVQPSRRVIDAAIASGRRSVIDLLRFSRAAMRARVDVMFYPAVYSWYPAPPGTRSVVTLHDAIAERFPHLIFPGRAGRLAWRAKVRLACAQAARLLTVSNAARAEITAHMGLDPARIDLTTEGPRDVFRARPLASRDQLRRELAAKHHFADGCQILAYVGGFAPHKNVGALLAAIDGLSVAARERLVVLLVGDPAGGGFHSNYATLREAVAASAALRECVRFTGFVSDEDLAGIYAASTALVLPSLSEGFGLPAVEAMACACPVVASNGGSLPEVVGDGGLIFDLSDSGALTAALSRILGDGALRESLALRASARARHFTWQRGAALALECIERAHAERRQ